jgi:hypothetical protein
MHRRRRRSRLTRKAKSSGAPGWKWALLCLRDAQRCRLRLLLVTLASNRRFPSSSRRLVEMAKDSHGQPPELHSSSRNRGVPRRRPHAASVATRANPRGIRPENDRHR